MEDVIETIEAATADAKPSVTNSNVDVIITVILIMAAGYGVSCAMRNASRFVTNRRNKKNQEKEN